MKKLKTKLLFSLFFLIAVYAFFVIKNNYIKTSYNINSTNVKGHLYDYYIDGNLLTLKLKNKEKIIVNYYFKSLEEKNNYISTLKLGDYYNVVGEFKEPTQNTNFYLFNYKNYLYSNKIYWTVTANEIKLLKKNDNIFYNIKNEIIKKINNSENSIYLNLFILGNNKYLDKDIYDSYKLNGISHLFAISGMHISLLSSALLCLLNKIIKRSNINYIIVILFLFYYMFLTNFSPSIIRATFLFTLISLKKLLKLDINNILILIFIFFMLLLINPYYIYNVGFVFSFSISFCLMYFNSIINKYKNYFIKLFVTSFISFLVSIPIMINNYHEINLLSPFLNLIFVPYVSIIIFPLSLITFIFPSFSSLLSFNIKILENISILLSNIKFLNLTMAHVSIYIIFIYYILIYLSFKKKRFILILFIVIFIHHNINYIKKDTELVVLDVGQGDSFLIILPYNKGNILIDTGGILEYKKEKWMERKNKYSIAQSVIIPYLKSRGINKIDYLILTHGDFDHMGESINLVNNFKIEQVIFNNDSFNDLELELFKVLEEKNISFYQNIKELNVDNNKLYFLNNKLYDNENDNSNVIYTELNGIKILLMGDAGIKVEEDIIKKYNLSDIDILKVGHHGSKTSSSEKFIDSINPKYSIISVGKNNRYGHPNNEVIENLRDTEIYRTDQNGSIMFKMKKNKLEIEICSP